MPSYGDIARMQRCNLFVHAYAGAVATMLSYELLTGTVKRRINCRWPATFLCPVHVYVGLLASACLQTFCLAQNGYSAAATFTSSGPLNTFLANTKPSNRATPACFGKKRPFRCLSPPDAA